MKYIYKKIKRWLMCRSSGIRDINGDLIRAGDRIKWKDGEFDVSYCNGAFKVMETKSFFEGARDGWLHEMVGRSCLCVLPPKRRICTEIEIINNP